MRPTAVALAQLETESRATGPSRICHRTARTPTLTTGARTNTSASRVQSAARIAGQTSAQSTPRIAHQIASAETRIPTHVFHRLTGLPIRKDCRANYVDGSK